MNAHPLRFSAAHKTPDPEDNAIDMTRKVMRDHAEEDTPRRVNIPDSWAGILMWAIGRHGPIVLFVATTWFLYQDNKVMQREMLEVAKAQIAVNAQVVSSMTELKVSLGVIADEAKRAHRANVTEK